MTANYPGASKVKVLSTKVAKITVGRPKAYYSRGGTKDLAADERSVEVLFTTPLKDANWVFGGMTVWNTANDPVDVVQISVMGISAKSQSGFTVLLSSAPPNANYKLDWTIAEAFNP